LVSLVFWAKLRRERERMHSQFGEMYVTYTHQTVGRMDGRLLGMLEVRIMLRKVMMYAVVA
jgi:hypothetical protein